MIKYCNTCKFYTPKDYDGKCQNPKVNKHDPYMLAHPKGETYGTDARDIRRQYSWPWSKGICGIQGKFWELKEDAQEVHPL